LGEPFVRPFRELLGHIDDPDVRRAMKQALRLNRLHTALEPLADVFSRRRLRARLRDFDVARSSAR